MKILVILHMRKDSSGIAPPPPCSVMATIPPMPPTKRSSSIITKLFSSVFTQEPGGQISAMPDIELLNSDVKTLLDNLKPHKPSTNQFIY